MKVFTTAASILLVATIAHGECVVVVPVSRPSKQNAHVWVTVDGKPAARLPIRLEITLFPSGKKSETQFTTDEYGAFNLPRLAVGQNCVTADAEPRLNASMCLDVTAAHDSTATEFHLELTALPPPPPTLEELVKQHKKSPIELSSSAFVGTVTDQTAAGIMKAEITVFRRDAVAKSDHLKIQADEDGKFTAVLEPGTYTMVVMAQGFSTRFVGVEIKQDAPKEEMSIELKIAAGC
jgi:hypothetical protein